MKYSNAIVCPIIYEGTSFEDIFSSLKKVIDDCDLPIEFIGIAPFEKNDLRAGILDDERYIRHHISVLQKLSEARHIKKMLFIDFSEPGIDLVKYAFEQNGVKCKFGSLLHGGSFLHADLYSWKWLPSFEKAWSSIYDMMSDLHKRQVDSMREEGGTYVGTIYRRKRNDKTRAEVRFDGTAGCLRTPRGGSARQIIIVLDKGNLKMRWMSPREYARLQGADDFPLVEKKNQNLFGFGDAVCVPVIRWIDQNVLTPIYDSINSR